MKNWFRKTPEKKAKDQKPGEEAEKEHNISSLYEIVEDHLKSLDYDQLKSISDDFADRFAAHRQIISEIVRTPPPERGRDRVNRDETIKESDEFVVIDTRRRAPAAFRLNAPDEAYPDEMILSHYDQMIRSQYDRLIDLTMDFLKEVTETEVRRLDSETAKIASDVQQFRDVLAAQIEHLGEDLDETRELHRGFIAALEDGIVQQNRQAALAFKRIKILVFAVIGAGFVGGAALVLALIR
jgi:hypothetical protein